jgi:hypothetical protein
MPEQASAVEVDMRPDRALLALLVLVGISFAQDTNFSVGPQYLVTTGSTLLMNPIATPSLSLSGETLTGTTAVPITYEPPAFAPVETYVYLDNVYWGQHNTREVLARRIEPPSMTPDQTTWYMNFVASQLTSPAPAPSAETTAPGGIHRHRNHWRPIATNARKHMDVGVMGRADPLALQNAGTKYLLEMLLRTGNPQANRRPRFTNSDVTRLRIAQNLLRRISTTTR